MPSIEWDSVHPAEPPRLRSHDARELFEEKWRHESILSVQRIAQNKRHRSPTCCSAASTPQATTSLQSLALLSIINVQVRTYLRIATLFCIVSAMRAAYA